MTKSEYDSALEKFSSLSEEMKKWTVKEEENYIVMYTRILTDAPGFHKYMEQYEIYNGRRTFSEFKDIILKRYQNIPLNGGSIFECAFFQNIVEDLILFHQLTDDQISQFYKELFSVISNHNFMLFYLYEENVEEVLTQISNERCDEVGNKLWLQLMLSYLEESPYGKRHKLKGFEGLLEHLKHRQKLELRILQELPENHVIVLPAKKYTDEQVIIR